MEIALSDKQRLLTTAQTGGDWRAMAAALEINYKTAWQWVNLAEKTGTWIVSPPKRGGARYNKITPAMRAYLCARMDVNCHLTLGEIADALRARFSISVCPQAVKNAVNRLRYTIKGVHQQSDKMNSDINKSKRLDYLIKLVEFQALGKSIFYCDETDYNVWCARKAGRAPKGSRLSKTVTVSKGANVHVVACISSTGLTYWERRFGSNNADTSNKFLRQLLHKIAENEQLENVVVVLDNAPCHKRPELVFQELPFSQASLLRLGPYSPMLNPIENVFSTIKSHIKKYLVLHRQAIIRTL